MHGNEAVRKPQKKHIGIVHYTLPPAISGVEMVVRDHARILSNLGFKLYLLGATGKKFRKEIDVRLAKSFDPKNEQVLTTQEDLNKGIVPEHFQLLVRKYEKIIFLWIKKNKIETVIVHNILSRHYNLALTSAIVNLAQQTHHHLKWITWIHDASYIDTFYTKIPQDLKNTFPWNLIAHPQKHITYVAVSKTRKQELLKMYGKWTPINVIPNGLDINKMLPLPRQSRLLFSEMLERSPDYIAAIPVRIAQRKNIEYAISFAKVARDEFHKNFLFVVTGAAHLQNSNTTSYLSFLKNEIAKHQLQKQFIFLYEYKLHTKEKMEKFDINKLNIRDLYLLCDFLFLPSKGEGFGLPLIEAGFIRLPIFASNLPVFKEVGNGYINFIDLNGEVSTNVKMIINYLEKHRSTLFHKQILKQYSLEAIVKNQVAPLL